VTPCDWPLAFVCEPESCPHFDQLPPDLQDTVEALATTWLWLHTGQRFGNCDVTVRPCNVSPGCWDYGLPYPVRVDGQWYNLCGHSMNQCTCQALPEVPLPGPVLSVTEVKVDGVVVPAADYRIDNRRWLVRTDGARWPTTQDLALADTEPGTWAVTYTPGEATPAGGELAAGSLACQLARQCTGQKCDLPTNWANITRQGVSLNAKTVEAMTPKRTGIFLIDTWVDSVNAPVATVRSPDVVLPRVTTWVAPAP
jgi:hypothetical protein